MVNQDDDGFFPLHRFATFSRTLFNVLGLVYWSRLEVGRRLWPTRLFNAVQVISPRMCYNLGILIKKSLCFCSRTFRLLSKTGELSHRKLIDENGNSWLGFELDGRYLAVGH